MKSLSIIIPAFEEELRLPRTLELLKQSLDQGHFGQFAVREILVVDDGSRDQTSQTAKNFATKLPPSTRLSVIRLDQNCGKGHAVRKGLLQAGSEWVLVADADCSTPWDQCLRLQEQAFSNNLSIVMGSRGLRESDVRIHQAWWRENMGKTFNLLVRLFTSLPFKDTQCGFKLIHLPSVRPFLNALQVNRFAWDVEFLVAAQSTGLKIAEIPVQWEHREKSRVRPLQDSLEMLWSILRLRWRLRSLIQTVTQQQLPWALILFYLVVLVLPLGFVIDRDEAWYSSISLEMFKSGDWIVPTFNGKLFAEKPALTYWITALSFHLFGVSEFSTRLFVTLATALTTFVVYLFGRELTKSREQALLAAWIFSTCVFTAGISKVLLTDQFYVLFLVSALWLLYRHRFFYAAGFTALAFLTKGIIGLAIPYGVFGFYALASNNLKLLFGKRLILSVIFAVALALPWYLGVNLKTNGEFFHEFFYRHHFHRMSQPMENHQGPLYYYMITLALTSLPWTLLIFAGWFNSLKNLLLRKAEPLEQFCVIWAMIPFAAFTLMATKLPHYIYPIFPALAVLAARFLGRQSQRTTFWYLPTLILPVIFLFLAFYLKEFQLELLKSRMLVFATALGISAVLIFIVRDPQRRLLLVGVYSLVFLVFGWSSLLTGFSKFYNAVPQIAMDAKMLNHSGKVAVCEDVFEPSMVFYMQRPLEIIASAQMTKYLEKGYDLIVSDQNKRDLDQQQSIQTKILAKRSGLRLGKVSFIELLLIRRLIPSVFPAISAAPP